MHIALNTCTGYTLLYTDFLHKFDSTQLDTENHSLKNYVLLYICSYASDHLFIHNLESNPWKYWGMTLFK